VREVVEVEHLLFEAEVEARVPVSSLNLHDW